MKTKHLFLMAIVALVTLSSCGGSEEKSKGTGLSYAPWTDLSMHFDLTKVKSLSGSNVLSFNSYELTSARLPMTSERLEQGDYNAVVLGTSVWMRTKPVVANSTKYQRFNTGQRFVVTRHNFFTNGRFWHYGMFPIWDKYSDGYFSQQGYICSDYVVSVEQYEILKRYVFNNSSNINYGTPSKELHAVADVLLKLDADKRMTNMSVVKLNEFPFAQHKVVAYQFRDYSMPNNNCMLAIVQFNNTTNDFVVLGIVPGNAVNQIQPNVNGSYDVYFY